MGCVANWGRFGSICIELSSRQVVTGSFSSSASKIGRRFKMFRGDREIISIRRRVDGG